ncbi:hypothetical protein AAGW05_02800 [Arthrobacter sp. LAPM80]|uniref:hypothetical protein n=1 Tax=Arthrobacter sp. LAPM80 TaxID=3141788 RepID=UPI00398AE9FE
MYPIAISVFRPGRLAGIPRWDIAAITFTLTTPVALLLVSPRGLFRRNRAFLWLLVATAVSAMCSALVGGALLSMGSPEGAAGDIGALPLWLLSTGGLITSSMFAVRSWHGEPKGPPATLRGLQLQERRAKRNRK